MSTLEIIDILTELLEINASVDQLVDRCAVDEEISTPDKDLVYSLCHIKDAILKVALLSGNAEVGDYDPGWFYHTLSLDMDRREKAVMLITGPGDLVKKDIFDAYAGKNMKDIMVLYDFFREQLNAYKESTGKDLPRLIAKEQDETMLRGYLLELIDCAAGGMGSAGSDRGELIKLLQFEGGTLRPVVLHLAHFLWEQSVAMGRYADYRKIKDITGKGPITGAPAVYDDVNDRFTSAEYAASAEECVHVAEHLIDIVYGVMTP